MRIVQLITHMNELGGAQVHVRDLARRLAVDGHTVTIVSGGEETIAEDLVIPSVEFVHSKFLIRNIHPIKDFIALLDIRKKIKKIRPEIVAIHSSKAGILGRIACWSLRIPFVFTAHGWSFTEGVEQKKQNFYRRIEKWIGKISSTVITVCDYDRSLALKHQVLPYEKLKTIHNGVLDKKDTSSGKEPREIVKILMVARFEKPKKQQELLEKLLLLKDLNWHMIFAGDGSLRQKSSQFVLENNLGHKVTFLGNHSNIADLLSDSDLFILNSSWEGLPLSILEAMSQGLPIIASNVGGVKEAVRDWKNGFLIHEDLSEKLTILIKDELLRKKMGEKSREIYEASFRFEKMYEKTVSTYHNLTISGENN
ncbi:glycosyltransferase family 4 protein [Psychrobacillus sp. NEAU-3TGS]|uniref:glycosyltransferase family 4 protein n=1 Tax=Psychrobacillus sp. NEAU-3TGS TaxID=2995412 RepID=UPI002496E4D9|nr:glycosyltransferase family 4 protein [Psychrobacillus sp. NEAU-3TGS]MDI2586526.1 glycosyltransferase family 4 protein [Psychrobacillus sp. NEAU-3TGS]